MAFDATFLAAVMEEIRQRTQEARVDKIHQPSRDTVILQLKCREGREKLLFALNPTAPRLHLTNSTPENPPEPPMFCMLLRKHLLGARLVETKQIPMERCAMFTFDCIDEMGDHVNKTLMAEICTCSPRRVGSSIACAASAWTKAPSGQPCRVLCTRNRSPSPRKIPGIGKLLIMLTCYVILAATSWPIG